MGLTLEQELMPSGPGGWQEPSRLGHRFCLPGSALSGAESWHPAQVPSVEQGVLTTGPDAQPLESWGGDQGVMV